jgi:hypothetical protein
MQEEIYFHGGQCDICHRLKDGYKQIALNEWSVSQKNYEIILRTLDKLGQSAAQPERGTPLSSGRLVPTPLMDPTRRPECQVPYFK